MKPSIASRLAQLSARLEELNALLSSEDVTKNLENYRKLTREHAEISPAVELYKAYEKSAHDIAAAHDIVVTCTASTLPILGKGMIERAIKARRHRPILMIDLAVPRDVEAEVAELDDVFLYDLDDLGKIVQEGIDTRHAAVAQAEAIINTNVHAFMQWLENREIVPTIRALRDQAERTRRHELERASRMLAKGDEPAKVLEQLSHSLTNKFLHGPTQALNGVEANERDALIAALTRLHGVKPPE